MRIPGSWTVARPSGVPIRIHWSVPVCALLAGGIHFAPGAWLAYLLLVLIHEAGHAFVVRRVGARALSLDVLGFGGLCQWEGTVSPIGRACIAWGGIWAQMIVLALAATATALFGKPGHWFAAQMMDVAIMGNLWLIGINLLPIPPLDGKEAWALFPLLRRRFSARPAPPVLASKTFRVITVPHLDPRKIKEPTPSYGDELDDAGYTPEVEDVLERVRAIAREAARGPQKADKVPGPGDPGSGGS